MLVRPMEMSRQSSLTEALGLPHGPASVVALLTALGFTTSVVQYEPEELDVPPYLSREVDSWCLVSHYPGDRLPFQAHLVQLKALTWWHVSSILEWFSRRHPGFYLFVATRDFRHLALATGESSLERRPPPGTRRWPVGRRQHGARPWPFLPKVYPRLLLVDRANPSLWQLSRLQLLRVEPGLSKPRAIHDRVLAALKVDEQPEPFPPWFFPRSEVEGHVSSVRSIIEECLDSGILQTRRLRLANRQLNEILSRPEYTGALPWWHKDRLVKAHGLVEEAIDPSTAKEDRAELLEEALSQLNDWRL